MTNPLIQKLRACIGSDQKLRLEDFPTEPIGGSNPYSRCSECKRSVPEITYRGHYDFCSWTGAIRKAAEAEALLKELERQLQGKPFYRIATKEGEIRELFEDIEAGLGTTDQAKVTAATQALAELGVTIEILEDTIEALSS
ncbi:hypothetical protein [Myxococcus phage Mx1]|nr:hypothetical protein [Myxococcus phage Mx1]